MEEKSKKVEKLDKAATLGSGAMLAAARKKQDKSIEEIAEELNLSLTQIRTIELDQSEGLPEPTYVRGYIRSYASLLGLDPEKVLQHYHNKNWQKSANLDDMPRGIGDAESVESSLFSPARVIVFLLIAGLVLFLWLKGGIDGILGGNNADTAVTTQVSSDVLSDISNDIEAPVDGDVAESDIQILGNPLSEQGTANQGQETVLSDDDTEQTVSLVTADTDLSSSVSGDTSAPAALPSDVANSGQTRVVLTFTETSWVDIRDEQQNRLAYQSYPRGKTLDVSAEGALSVLIGNAKGVQMSLNGKPYNLGQHTEGVYAKFTVGEPSE